MKVLHVVPSYYPAHVYGGPIQSVHNLNLALAAQGITIRVLTTDTNGNGRLTESGQTIHFTDGMNVHYCRKLGFPRDFSPQLFAKLSAGIRWADVVHLTAVYSFPTIPTLALGNMHQKPIVWSPRGAFQHWHGSPKPVAKYVWDRICGWAASNRTVIHAASVREKEAAEKRLPGVTARVVMNGVLLPVARDKNDSERFRLLFLGRLHPIKGIENLLEACALLLSANQKFILKIAGSGEPRYVESLMALVAKFDLARNVEFLGQVDEQQRSAVLFASDVLVLPSYSENFGLVVAEALAHSVAAIATPHTAWTDLDSRGAGLCANNSPQELCGAIRKIMASDFRAMGVKGRLWMQSEYSWDNRAREMKSLYEDLVNASSGAHTSR
jgi:glycosyltransferase involved in cell wall biosynthesis